ncbi:MAG TPA: hypothetical protein VGC31_00885 [Paenirhodobacter sp.]
MQLPALFNVMREEGIAYGADLHEELLGSPADEGWRATVAAIHDPARLLPRFNQRFATALAAADQAAIEAWFAQAPGNRIVTHEIETRKRLLDPAAEDSAEAQAQAADLAGNPKLAAVRRVIAATDLVEANVVGGMNANLAFYKAMAAGGAFPDPVGDDTMLDDIAAQEDDIRQDVTVWLESYLFQAYEPLSIQDLDRLAAFSRSVPGQQVLRAEFDAFDAVFEETSAELGAALARRITATDL